MIVKKTFLKKTKVNRSSFNSVLDDLQLDSIIYPRLLTAESIIKYARSMNNSLHINVENLYKLEDGKVEALEFLIKNDDPRITNIPLMNLPIKKNILVCCINRQNRIIIPGGQDVLQPGDSVVVVLTGERLQDISDILMN